MEIHGNPKVAILLATYNGARFVAPQIQSLKENKTAFSLHWLDDHSTDGTREAVRFAARACSIHLVEWHQPERQGYPGSFFQLLESVAADIYMFCDQDDIWQAGKIDATVRDLLPDVDSPVLCFSEAMIFRNEDPANLRRLFKTIGEKIEIASRESKAFISFPAQGNTIGLTRPLRDIYLKHKEIARGYSPAHDWWLHLIAVASGTSRMLTNVPTTMWRLHGKNLSGFDPQAGGIRNLAARWRQQQAIRRWISKQARGFSLAAATLTPGPKLDRLLSLAPLVETLDKRQSPVKLARLALRGAMPARVKLAIWFTVACLCSEAPSPPGQ